MVFIVNWFIIVVHHLFLWIDTCEGVYYTLGSIY